MIRTKTLLLKYVDIAMSKGHSCYSKRGRKAKCKGLISQEEDCNQSEDASHQNSICSIKKQKLICKKRELESITKQNYEDLINVQEKILNQICIAKFNSKPNAEEMVDDILTMQNDLALLLKKSSELLLIQARNTDIHLV